MKKKPFSFYDSKGKLFVDCSECNRGGNGAAPHKCACGWKVKKGRMGGCFTGELIDGLEVMP